MDRFRLPPPTKTLVKWIWKWTSKIEAIGLTHI